MDWKEVIQSVEFSRKLLEALWNLDGEAVAKGIDQAHREISVLQYNDENSLSCTINLVFYFAREVLYSYPGTANRKRLCRYLLYPKKVIR